MNTITRTLIFFMGFVVGGGLCFETLSYQQEHYKEAIDCLTSTERQQESKDYRIDLEQYCIIIIKTEEVKVP